MSDRSVLVCRPIGAHEQGPVPGARRWCGLCGTDVWVSNSALAQVDSGDYAAHCVDCAAGLAALDPDPSLAMTEAQVEEMADAWGLSGHVARRLLRRAGIEIL